ATEALDVSSDVEARGVEVPDRRPDRRVTLLPHEEVHRLDAAVPRDEIRPGPGNVVPHRRDAAHTGHHDAGPVHCDRIWFAIRSASPTVRIAFASSSESEIPIWSSIS